VPAGNIDCADDISMIEMITMAAQKNFREQDDCLCQYAHIPVMPC
jgi:hypothetical protein